MNRLIILLLLLSCSCTKDENIKKVKAPTAETGLGNIYSDRFAGHLAVKDSVDSQEIQSVYSSISKGIRPDMPKDSLKKVLETIHYWDQVYRDSLMEGNAWVSDKIKFKKYSKEMSRWDKMNQRVVVHLLNKFGGWPDTKNMGNKASMAIWLVIHHNFDNRDFSSQILPYLDKAYHSDSVINKNMYVDLYDRVNYKLNGYSKYGTYGFHKDHFPDSVRNRVNLERTAIGLEKL
ncbi:hypothetical protein H7F15_19065 [Pontibacter sp. Tf4]|uniref:hypothetical protein n=1 Tax=Pontibacter sp. Tf4 TaxID=2761620 RepID=UPI001623CD13|nr:hypothetical protein [Pontibacter sp. Tf4]MBB6613148.1 hypothetical protein [Pontibacter sp. Tf4]